MLGPWVRSLVWEDSTCLRAVKPVSHNYWAWVLQLLKPTYPTACALQWEKHLQWEACTPQQSSSCWQQLEKARKQQWRPSTVKKKKKKKKIRWINKVILKNYPLPLDQCPTSFEDQFPMPPKCNLPNYICWMIFFVLSFNLRLKRRGRFLFVCFSCWSSYFSSILSAFS